jgi:hypothetical protein
MKLPSLLLLTMSGIALVGCAGAASTPCTSTEVMSPAAASADHAATAPANSVQFSVGAAAQPGCAVSALVYLPTLTTSDPVNVSVATQGIATCIGATDGPVTLTDTRSKATSKLTCQ